MWDNFSHSACVVVNDKDIGFKNFIEYTQFDNFSFFLVCMILRIARSVRVFLPGKLLMALIILSSAFHSRVGSWRQNNQCHVAWRYSPVNFYRGPLGLVASSTWCQAPSIGNLAHDIRFQFCSIIFECLVLGLSVAAV